MLYPLQRYVNVLIELDIDSTQLLFLLIIHNREFALLYQIKNEGQGFDEDSLTDLEEKGLVVNNNINRNDYYADHYEVTELFKEKFFYATMQDAEQFWDEYPSFITINGKRTTTKAVNKQELLRWYHNTVTPAYDHQKIMDALYYAIDNQLINMRIDKWLQAESFKDIWKIMANRKEQELPHDRIL